MRKDRLNKFKKWHLILLVFWVAVGVVELVINPEVRWVFMWMMQALLAVWALSLAFALWLCWANVVKNLLCKIVDR